MVNLIRRRELVLVGASDAAVHRAVRAGRMVRVAPGTHVAVSDWLALEPMEQHRLRVIECARRLGTGAVLSHFAAAAMWRIRILGAWPTRVDVTLERAAGGRSSGHFLRHCTGLGGTEVTELEGLLVTSPAQTVVDLSRVLDFTGAVVAMDAALSRRRALTTVEAVAEVVERSAGRRGHARAIAVAEFATALSDSPAESHSRVLIHLLGFPRPVLQHRFALPEGGYAETDFYWPESDHVGECDGRAKYRDPALLRGRDPADVVIAEKNRENELRRVVSRLSRWEPADLRSPRNFYDRLTRDGLPSARPRP